MHGLTRHRCARVINAEHAFIQNLHHGHDELEVEKVANHRVLAAFTEVALAI